MKCEHNDKYLSKVEIEHKGKSKYSHTNCIKCKHSFKRENGT